MKRFALTLTCAVFAGCGSPPPDGPTTTPWPPAACGEGTGITSHVLFPEPSDADTIYAIGASGVCAGKEVVPDSGPFALTVWGDDMMAATPHGLERGERFWLITHAGDTLTPDLQERGPPYLDTLVFYPDAIYATGSHPNLDTDMALKKITIDYAVPSALTDFPLYLKPSATTGLGALTLAEAQSIRVYADEAKTTEYSREVVSADEIHIKIPNLSAASEYYVDYDGVRSDYAATHQFGAQAVWAGAAAVWHMDDVLDQDNTTFEVLDASTNANAANAVNEVTVITLENTLLGQGYSITTDDQYFNAPDHASLNFGTGSFTVSGLFKVSVGSVINYSALIKKANDRQYKTITGYILGLFGNNIPIEDATIRAYIGDGTNTAEVEGGTVASYGASSWHRTSMVVDRAAGVMELFVDGVSQGQVSITNIGSVSNLNEQYLAVDNTPLYGLVDEMRIAPVARSADWIATTWANESNPGAFQSAQDVGTDSAITMTGAAAGDAEATAGVLRDLLAQAEANGVAGASAGLRALRALSTRAEAETGALVSLAVARQMAAQAEGIGTASAQAQTVRQMKTAASALSDASGGLAKNASVLLIATAAAVAGATGTLSIQRLLGGRSAAMSGVEAEATIERVLAATTETESQALAQAVVERLLSAVAGASAGAGAVLAVQRLSADLVPTRRTFTPPTLSGTFASPAPSRTFRP